MSAHGGAYMDVTRLTQPQTDQPVNLGRDDGSHCGYGYRVEILGDLFILRSEQLAGEREQGYPAQRADRRIGQKGNHWHPGETRRH